jgi:hypothetical protein
VTAAANDLLTPQEVADIFRVEVQTLAKWRWQKIGPDYIKIGRMVRYHRASVDSIRNGGTPTVEEVS